MKSVFSHKLTTLLAVVLAVMLAGCGGSDDTMDEATPTMMDPVESNADKQMRLIADASAGLTEALAALDEDAPTETQIADVQRAINLLANALGGAHDLTPTQTASARSALAAARTTVSGARTTLGSQMTLAERRTMQSGAIRTAQTELSEAIEALDDTDAGTIAAVNTAITALKAAVDAGADLTDAEKMMAMANLRDAEVDIAEAELATATRATQATGAADAAMLEAYQAQEAAAARLLAALKANNGSAADIEAATRTHQTAQNMVASLTKKVDAAGRLATNAMSMKVAEAINKHSAATDDTPSEFGVGTAGSEMEITRISDAATITPFQSSADKKTKPFALGSAQSAGTGWSGSTFTRSGIQAKKAFTETAVVYTDIGMAADALWASADFENGGSAVAVTGAVELDAVAVNVSRISISPNAPTGTDSASDSLPITAGTSRAGAYYGVQGNFNCAAGTNCVLTRDTKNMVSVSAGTITFVPSTYDAETTMAKYADSDENYTHFGYWMTKTKERDGSYSYDIKTFFGGEAENELAIGGLQGTAKYYGAAAGLYVKKDGAGDALIVTDGAFTADAMLTASFGSDVDVSVRNKVSGAISDFKNNGVDLGFADLVLKTTGTIDATDGSVTGTTDGGGMTGAWNGEFFGASDGPTTGTDDNYPTDVSGEFNGHFVNGHVAGAFGAELDQ